MSEKQYYSSRVSGDNQVDIVYDNEEGYSRCERLPAIINALNERIAALEAQVTKLLAQSQKTFGGQPI